MDRLGFKIISATYHSGKSLHLWSCFLICKTRMIIAPYHCRLVWGLREGIQVVFSTLLCRAGMTVRGMRCLWSCGYLLKFCIQRWFTHPTLDPVLILDIPKVLCEWLLLFYIPEGSSIFGASTTRSSRVEDFRHFSVEARALVLEFAG